MDDEGSGVACGPYHFFYQGVFSQWWRELGFAVGDTQYNCAEQFMMHEKALFFGDRVTALKIMLADHPHKQKALGREVKGFDKAKWNEVARDIVYMGNWHKFTIPSLKEQLLATTGTLVEASPTDQIWGIGLGLKDPNIHDPSKWEGTNWLGEVLTKVRDDMKAGKRRTEGFDWK